MRRDETRRDETRRPCTQDCYVEGDALLYVYMYVCVLRLLYFCALARARAQACGMDRTFLLLVGRMGLRVGNLYVRLYNIASRCKCTMLLSLRLAFALARVQQLALTLAALDLALVPLAVALGTVAHEPAM